MQTAAAAAPSNCSGRRALHRYRRAGLRSRHPDGVEVLKPRQGDAPRRGRRPLKTPATSDAAEAALLNAARGGFLPLPELLDRASALQAAGRAQANCGQMAALAAVRELQRTAVFEAVAVAQADGQAVSLQASLAAVERIAATMPAQHSSTAQDLARGRTSEVEHLNGFIVSRGAELGVATPVNQALYALVKLAEATAAGRA